MNNLSMHQLEYVFISIFELAKPYLPYAGGCLILFLSILIYLKSRKKVSLKKAKSKTYVNNLSWRDFEVLVAKYYKKKGYSVSLEGGSGGDDGIDITLKKNKKKTIVQCKHWKSRSVGVAIIREMFGVMVSENANSVFIITSGKFTKEAYKFAEGKPIQLINGNRLNSMLKD